MRSFAIALLAGIGALSIGSAARATDIYSTTEYSNADLVQQVRLVCDDAGRCYRTHGGSRVIVRDSYNYMPRERYIERREYRDWDSPRAGVGIRAPGVSVGVGDQLVSADQTRAAEPASAALLCRKPAARRATTTMSRSDQAREIATD